MSPSLRHIAIVVPNLEAAEKYYQAIFDMTLVGREAEQADGQWYSMPFDKSWQDAHAAGIHLDMVALQKGGFVLALFAGDAAQGQVFAIGLNIPADEIAGVRSRLPDDTEITANSPHYLEFYDPYRILWQLSIPGEPFRTAGEITGRWIEI